MPSERSRAASLGLMLIAGFVVGCVISNLITERTSNETYVTVETVGADIITITTSYNTQGGESRLKALKDFDYSIPDSIAGLFIAFAVTGVFGFVWAGLECW